MPPDRGYEILEHTADVGLRVWGPDLSAVFEQAAFGLIGIMGEATGPATRSEEIAFGAPDDVALLVDWSSEGPFLFDARGFVPRTIHASVEASRVRAVIHGGDAAQFTQGGPAVKAITYHDAMVRATPDGYEARVYLDV